jgi:hypothetical protein
VQIHELHIPHGEIAGTGPERTSQQTSQLTLFLPALSTSLSLL